MLVICRSPKGGVGTSVVAAAMALCSAHGGRSTLLVDLAGDQIDLLGLAPAALGVGDWLAGGEDMPVDALASLEVEAAQNLSVLPRGVEMDQSRLPVLAEVLASGRRTVVVDAGRVSEISWADGLATEVVVLRACYLAVKRAGRLAPDCRLVLIQEPGRALRVTDVESAVGVSVWRRVVADPAVARAVDAGLIGIRLPRSLRHLELPS